MRGFTHADESDLRRLLRQLLQAGPDVTADSAVEALSPGQLSARIKAVLRLPGTAVPEPVASLRFGDLRIDPATREVEVGSRLIDLTAKEFDLLLFMASSPRQVFSRQQLLEHVWSSCREWQDEATVTEHVRRVRQKIEVDPSQPLSIRTVRGVGYKFVSPVEPLDLAAVVALPPSPRRPAPSRCALAYRELPARRSAPTRRSQGFC